jgi:hypothetical protein
VVEIWEVGIGEVGEGIAEVGVEIWEVGIGVEIGVGIGVGIV